MTLAIELYKNEKSKLELLIKECLEEFDGPNYLLAYYHQQALWEVNRTLSMLNGFEDNLYDEKQFNLSLISKVEKDIETANSEFIREHYEKMLSRYKKRQLELESIPKLTATDGNDKVLDKALLDLLEKKIKKFSIVFHQSKNIYVEFSIRGKIIKVVAASTKSNKFHFSDLELLRKLGFNMTNSIKPFMHLENKGIETISKLNFLLIRLVFDVFYQYRDTNISFIKFE